MKKNNYAIITITIIIMLIIILSATYAFFATNMSLINNVILNVEVPDASRATFTSYSTNPLQLNVEAANVLYPSTTATVTDTGDLIIKYSSPAANDEYECTYDVLYVWDTNTQYTSPTVTLSETYPYEISISGMVSATGDSFSSYDYTSKNLIEKDLSQFSWVGTPSSVGRYAKIIEGAKIYTNSVSGTTVTWTFNMNFYSLPVSQTRFSGSILNAHIVTGNVRC